MNTRPELMQCEICKTNYHNVNNAHCSTCNLFNIRLRYFLTVYLTNRKEDK